MENLTHCVQTIEKLDFCTSHSIKKIFLKNWCDVMLPMGLKTDGAVSIGDVSIKLKTPSSPELVPVKYGE